MRMSQLFGRTLKEIPSEAEISSHQLLLRAGMIHRLAAGMYSYLPLAYRSIRKIEQIIREEMNAIGGQEINMPLVHPAEIWQESGRWQSLVGKELASFTDRFDRQLVLAMTHEEAVTDLARNIINSYRQLPCQLYQIKLKFRDELRPRAGLIRVREFVMKDAYSFHTSQADLDQYYDQIYQSYLNIFHRAGINVVVVDSDTGMIGGSAAHEFMLVCESGEDNLILCSECNYTANAEVAVFQKTETENQPLQSLVEVATPGQQTIEEVATFLGVGKNQTLKAVFYTTSEGEVAFVVIRGDLEVNHTKLVNALGSEVRIASAEEVSANNLVAGYASPIGINAHRGGFDSIKIVVDESVTTTTNLVAGANKVGYHLRNANYPRDFQGDIVTDLALAEEGSTCVKCGGQLSLKKGIEVGNIFKLGTKYSEAMKATYLDQNGKAQPIVMGCYGIGVGRLLASVVEANHDEHGIIFPKSIAPYQIHLMHIGKGQEVVDTAEKLYADWIEQGLEVLYDDRSESPGFKFKEADLIGLPLRVTVSQKTVSADSVEIKHRHHINRELVRINDFDPILNQVEDRPL